MLEKVVSLVNAWTPGVWCSHKQGDYIIHHSRLEQKESGNVKLSKSYNVYFIIILILG